MCNIEAGGERLEELARHRQEQVRRQAQAAMAAAGQRLAAAGVEQVVIEYDGYGDEGAIQEITATAGRQELPLDNCLREALAEAACGLLPAGWQDGEGACGQLVLDVPLRKLTRRHHWRVIETEYDEEVLAL